MPSNPDFTPAMTSQRFEVRHQSSIASSVLAARCASRPQRRFSGPLPAAKPGGDGHDLGRRDRAGPASASVDGSGRRSPSSSAFAPRRRFAGASRRPEAAKQNAWIVRHELGVIGCEGARSAASRGRVLGVPLVTSDARIIGVGLGQGDWLSVGAQLGLSSGQACGGRRRAASRPSARAHPPDALRTIRRAEYGEDVEYVETSAMAAWASTRVTISRAFWAVSCSPSRTANSCAARANACISSNMTDRWRAPW